jgi:transposase-like protein
MPEKSGGSRAGKRRSKRPLSPSQKYEVWLQLLRQEVTIAQAASAHQVDRSTIMRDQAGGQRRRVGGSRRPNPESSPGSVTTSWSGPVRRSRGCPRRAKSSR